MITISERLAETKGRPAGFDYMRVSLAVLIVGFHTVVTSYGEQAQTDMLFSWRPLWTFVLPMFFALSGFLVSGSLERCRTIVSFLGLRVIRLVPALAVESLVSMLIIGIVFTTLPLREYLTDRAFYHYLLNIVGRIHYELPGVFLDNPLPARVNGQLWTLPFELECYVAITIFALLGAYRLRALMVIGCVLLQGYAVYEAIALPTPYGLAQGRNLVLAFMYGSLLYRFRDHLPWNGRIALLSALVAGVLLRSSIGTACGMLPAAYLTVYLGLLDPPRNPAVSSGDYSYGIFLYGFPIQQAIAAALPDARHWWLNLVIALPIVIALAWLSWHFVEQPALALRKPLKRLEAMWLPINDAIFSFSIRLMPAGLRTRWAPERAQITKPVL